MHIPDSNNVPTKAQRQRLLRKLREQSIRIRGEASPLDDIFPLVDQIMEIVHAETKGLNSRNPKVRERAWSRTLEIGDFFMDMMARTHPTYLSLLWQQEHKV